MSVCINSTPIGLLCVKLNAGEFYDIQYVPILFRNRQNSRELLYHDLSGQQLQGEAIVVFPRYHLRVNPYPANVENTVSS